MTLKYNNTMIFNIFIATDYKNVSMLTFLPLMKFIFQLKLHLRLQLIGNILFEKIFTIIMCF